MNASFVQRLFHRSVSAYFEFPLLITPFNVQLLDLQAKSKQPSCRFNLSEAEKVSESRLQYSKLLDGERLCMITLKSILGPVNVCIDHNQGMLVR